MCKAKISSSLYALNKVKSFVPLRLLRTLYFSLAYPYLAYGILIWGSAYRVNLDKLIIIQKRCVRIIAGVGYRHHTTRLFAELKIIKLEDIYCKEVAKFVYKYIHNELPDSLQHLFCLNSQIYQRQTRQGNNLHVKKCLTTLAKHISYKGPQIWNSLPSALKSFASAHTKIMINSYS